MALNDTIKTFDINKELNIFNLVAKQNDTTGARSFTFRLIKNNQIFDLTGLNIKVGGNKADGKQFFNNCKIINASKGLVELELTTQMLAAAGTLNVELIILQGNVRLSTIPFEIEIIPSVTKYSNIISSDEFGVLTDAINKADEYGEKLKEGTEKIELTYADKLNSLASQLYDIEQETTSMFNGSKVNCIAHRGCWINVPENTLSAIKEAKKYKYDFVELDISRTSDGIWCLMHDLTLDRTTNGTGTMTEVTWDYVKNLEIDFLKYDDKIYRVPTFESAVKLCKELELGINIDCSKIDWTEEKIIEVVEILNKYNMFEKCFFVVEPSVERILTKLYPNVYVTWLWETSDDNNNLIDVQSCKTRRHAFIARHIKNVTDYLVSICMEYDVKLFVYGCNDLVSFNKAKAYNAKFIETDSVLPQ